MSVTLKDTKYIAELSRLNFSEPELNKMTDDLNEILTYMGKLNELDTSKVEPLSHPVEITDAFRDDIPVESVSTKDGLSNSPSKDENFFSVPKVIAQ